MVIFMAQWLKVKPVAVCKLGNLSNVPWQVQYRIYDLQITCYKHLKPPEDDLIISIQSKLSPQVKLDADWPDKGHFQKTVVFHV